ncbi:MAG: FG-GAP repeat protein [Bacteriovoracaceae bacterium]
MIASLLTVLVSCNPTLQEKESKEAAQTPKGNYTLRLYQVSDSKKPVFEVTGSLLIGQKVTLYSGSRCERVRDIKTVKTKGSVFLTSAALVNNGNYPYKIRVADREGNRTGCLPTTVLYNFSDGYTLNPPTVFPGPTTNIERRPRLTVTGGQSGVPVFFYRDPLCLSSVGSAVADINGSASLVLGLAETLEDGAYQFYATTEINGEQIPCSDASDIYTVDSAPLDPYLSAGQSNTDNKNQIRFKINNHIQVGGIYSDVFLYQNSACSGAPDLVLDPDNLAHPIAPTLGEMAIDETVLTQDKVYNFYFTQEKTPGTGFGPGLESPCSKNPLIYTLDSAPKNFALDKSYQTPTNSKFLPAFIAENVHSDADVYLYQDDGDADKCEADSEAKVLMAVGHTGGNISITSTEDLVDDPEGTYNFYIRQKINGVDSTCVGPISYTVETTPILEGLDPSTPNLSSDPFPKLVAANISPLNKVNVFESTNCNGATRLTSGVDYTSAVSGNNVIVSILKPQAVGVGGRRNFSLTQFLDAGETQESDCTPIVDSVSYEITGTNFSVNYGPTQTRISTNSQPVFTVSNTLDNSRIDIYVQTAQLANGCVGGVDHTYTTTTALSENITFNPAGGSYPGGLDPDDQYYFYFIETVTIGAGAYTSDCLEIDYILDRSPKNLTRITPSPSSNLNPKFQVENISAAEYGAGIGAGGNNIKLLKSAAGTVVCIPGDSVAVKNESYDASTETLSFELDDGLITTEGDSRFFVYSTNNNADGVDDCSNYVDYRMEASPSLALAPETISPSNNLKPKVVLTGLVVDYDYEFFANGTCTGGAIKSGTIGGSTSAITEEIDLTATIAGVASTDNQNWPISARLKKGVAFTSNCVSVNYVFDAMPTSIQREASTPIRTSYDFNPKFVLNDLLVSTGTKTELHLYSDSSCTNEFLYDANNNGTLGEAADFENDQSQRTVTIDLKNGVAGNGGYTLPLADRVHTVYAKQVLGNFESRCSQVSETYEIDGAPTSLLTSTSGTISPDPHFGIEDTYNGATDVYLKVYDVSVTDTCSAGNLVTGAPLANIVGVDETFAFDHDLTSPTTPFKKSDSFEFRYAIVRDSDGLGVGVAPYYESDCTTTIHNYNFDAVIKNVEFESQIFVETNPYTWDNQGTNESISVINTTTPTLKFDNDFEGSTIGVYVYQYQDNADAAPGFPTTVDLKCAGTNVLEPSMPGGKYQIAQGSITSNGIYKVYVAQYKDQYNSNFDDCSSPLTFKVDGVSTQMRFATGTVSPSSKLNPSIEIIDIEDNNPAQKTGNFATVTAATNDQIAFQDTSATFLTATLGPGTYATPQALCTEVANQMSLASDPHADDNFTCSYNVSSERFNISSDGALFNILWSSATTNAEQLLGFSNAADDTGALTYTGDWALSDGVFEIDVTNNTIRVFDSVFTFEAVLASARYTTGANLATEIQTKLDAAAAAATSAYTFTVSFNELTGSFTISSGSGNFDILWSHVNSTAEEILGFNNIDDTGASSYSSDQHSPGFYKNIIGLYAISADNFTPGVDPVSDICENGTLISDWKRTDPNDPDTTTIGLEDVTNLTALTDNQNTTANDPLVGSEGTVFTKDGLYYIGLRIVSEDNSNYGTPERTEASLDASGTWNDADGRIPNNYGCLNQYLVYNIEATPTVADLQDTTIDSLTTNVARTGFDVTNTTSGSVASPNNSLRAYYTPGTPPTSFTSCDTAVITDSEGPSDIERIEDGTTLIRLDSGDRFPTDGQYTVYFKQFNSKRTSAVGTTVAVATDDFASDCIVDPNDPLGDIFTFTLDGKPKDISSSLSASFLGRDITFSNWDAGTNNIEVYYDPSGLQRCNGTMIENFTPAGVTGNSSSATITLSNLTDYVNLNDGEIRLFIDQAFYNGLTREYQSNCSEAVTWTIDGSLGLSFDGDASPLDQIYSDTDPSPEITVDATNLLGAGFDANNSIQVFKDNSCAGAPLVTIDNASTPTIAAVRGGASIELPVLAGDGIANYYIQQVYNGTNTYRSSCEGPYKYTLFYPQNNIVLNDNVKQWEPTVSITGLTTDIAITATLYKDSNCTVAADYVDGTNIITDGGGNDEDGDAGEIAETLYFTSDSFSHQVYVQLTGPGYASECLTNPTLIHSVNQRIINPSLSGSSDVDNNPTPSLYFENVISDASETMIQIYTKSGSTNCGTLVDQDSALRGGTTLTRALDYVGEPGLTEDGTYEFYFKQVHNLDADATHDANEYASNCSYEKVNYTLDGRPKNLGYATGTTATDNDTTPSFTMNNIYATNVVIAYKSLSDCNADLNRITTTRDSSTQFTVNAAGPNQIDEDRLYTLAFRQETAGGEYASTCSEEINYTLDRRPTGIALNANDDSYNPEIDVVGTIAGYTVELYTMDPDYTSTINITSTNKYLDFVDDGVDLQISIQETTYQSIETVCSTIATEMNLASNAASNNNTFTCTYNSKTNKVKLTSDGAALTLKWNTGAQSANSLASILMFSAATDDTGATSYVSDSYLKDGNGCDVVRGRNVSAGGTTKVKVADTDGDDDVDDASMLLPLDGTYTFFARQFDDANANGVRDEGEDISECTTVSYDHTFKRDLLSANFSFDGLPSASGQDVTPDVSLTGIVDDGKIELFYIDDPETAFDGFTDESGCPVAAVNISGGTIDLPAATTSIAAQTLSALSNADLDFIYPIYGYQTDDSGTYKSKCYKLGEYFLDIAPTFETAAPISPSHGKSHLFDLTVDNMVTGGTLELYYETCDKIAADASVAIAGASQQISVDLSTLADYSDNKSYRIYARQKFTDGSTYTSSCFNANSFNYNLKGAPKVSVINDVSPRSDVKPEVVLDEVIAGGTGVKIYLVEGSNDVCDNSKLVFDGNVNAVDSGDGTGTHTITELTNSIPNDGEYYLIATQEMDPGDGDTHSGCYRYGSPTKTLDSKLQVTITPNNYGVGNPTFDFVDSTVLENATSFSLYMGPSCQGTAIPYIEGTPLDISNLTFSSNHVVFSFKQHMDPTYPHQTVCSDDVVYDYNGLTLAVLSLNPGESLTPVIRVYNVAENEEAFIYSDSQCSSLMGKGIAGNLGYVDLISDPVEQDGIHNYYATKRRLDGTFTDCSKAFTTYTLDIGAAMTMALNASYSATDTQNAPQFDIGGVLENAEIKLYSDTNCSNLVGIGATAYGQTSITIQSAPLETNGSYTFRVKQRKAGFSSTCSHVFANYTYVNTPSSITLLDHSPSKNDQPTFRVKGTIAGATVNLYYKRTTNCEVPLGTAVVPAGKDFVDVTVDDLDLLAIPVVSPQTIEVYATHTIAAKTGSCSSAKASYSYDTTSEDWYLIHDTIGETQGTDLGRSIAMESGLTVVGEPGFASSGKSNQGKVTVYYNSAGDTIELREEITLSDAEAGDQFGHSVDVHFDAPNYFIVIGAPGKDLFTQGDDMGSVFVYKYHSTGGLTLLNSIYPSDSEADDRFGENVKIDQNGFAVAAPYRADNTGIVYYYENAGTEYNFLSEKSIPYPEANGEDALFGSVMQLDANRLILSSKEKEAFWIADLQTLPNATQYQLSTVNESDDFGSSLFMTGDHLFVGAPGHDNSNGRIYYYDLSDLDTAPVATDNDDTDNYQEFGLSVAVQSNGTDSLLVGAKEKGVETGVALLRETAADDFFRITPHSTGAESDVGHGVDVSSDGKTILISAPALESSVDSPSVYLYRTP